MEPLEQVLEAGDEEVLEVSAQLIRQNMEAYEVLAQ